MARNIAKRANRCQALCTVSPSWNPEGLCPNNQSVVINGKKLCGRHASKEALAILLAEDRAAILPAVPKQFTGVDVRRT